MSNAVLLEVNDRIATITLNRPDSLNAFNLEQCQALISAVEEVSVSEQVGAVVLTGAGRGFSAGADLLDNAIGETSLKKYLEQNYLPSLEGIMQSPKPFIGAISGPIAGIGIAFMLACDLVVMGESAFLRQPFIDINLIPDGGITWHLAHQLGHQRAYELIISGARVPASQCLDWGLANRVVVDQEVLSNARTWAAELVSKAPMSLAASKRALRDNASQPFAEGFALEAQLQDVLGFARDTVEGVTAFKAKRAPEFVGK